VNKELHIDILFCLREAVRRKGPKRMEKQHWFLLHDNAPAHRSVLVKDFLAKNNVKTLQHTPYSLNLAPADFYLFPQLKSASKGWQFCGATNIIKNVMEELKRLLQYGLQECFQPFLVTGRSVQP
jgi:hypothetical protein